MPHLIVRIVVNHEVTGKEFILTKIESSQYNPDHLDSLINICLSQALKEIKGEDIQRLKSWNPEVSVLLTTDGDEICRPSIHLNPETLMRLSEAGASFDFDPYV